MTAENRLSPLHQPDSQAELFSPPTSPDAKERPLVARALNPTAVIQRSAASSNDTKVPR